MYFLKEDRRVTYIIDILKSYILSTDKLSKKEKVYRLKSIEKNYEISILKNTITDELRSIMHEIKCIMFLEKFGKIEIAKDSKSQPGCDFKIFNSVNVEAVSITEGNNITKKELLDNDYETFNKVVDYTKLQKLLFHRITSAIYTKTEKYKDEITNKKIYCKSEPFIIFLNANKLNNSLIWLDYCKDANRFLLGMGDLALTIDTKENKVVKRELTFKPKSTKTNGGEIDFNFFINNPIISAIIISSSSIFDLYDEENTFIFMNPVANNKITDNNFKDVVIWKEDKKQEYCVFKNGNKLKEQP